jgi:DNA-binding CsgD family transcriptional regulator
MNIQIQFLIVILSLIAGVIAIFLSNRIMRKYPLSYLSSYFYFLVFIYIFSVYSIIGSQTVKLILQNNQTPLETINSISAVLIALGIPFLILSLYMFIRLSYEFFKIELPKIFVAMYFLVFVISFAGYAIMNIDIGGFEAINFFMDSKQLIWTYSALMIIIFGYSLLFVLFKTKSLEDKNQRNTYRWFILWYAIIISLSTLSLILTQSHIVFGLIFIAVLTGFHLIPVLFLNIYLQRYYVEKADDTGFRGSFEEVINKFEISKREAEIVELICAGMSNQEISDSLYISLQTVKDHIYRIFLKTGVKNRVQLSNLISSTV